MSKKNGKKKNLLITGYLKKGKKTSVEAKLFQTRITKGWKDKIKIRQKE